MEEGYASYIVASHTTLGPPTGQESQLSKAVRKLIPQAKKNHRVKIMESCWIVLYPYNFRLEPTGSEQLFQKLRDNGLNTEKDKICVSRLARKDSKWNPAVNPDHLSELTAIKTAA